MYYMCMFLYKKKTELKSNKNKTLTTVQPGGVSNFWSSNYDKVFTKYNYHYHYPNPLRPKLKYVLAPVLSPGTAAQAHELSSGPHLFYLTFYIYVCMYVYAHGPRGGFRMC